METLPEDIVGFVTEYIESIDQLEILRVLGENRQKEWEATALCRVLQADPQGLESQLKDMQARGLLTAAKRAEGLSCRYSAGTPEIEAKLSRLLQYYRERPVTMIRLVYDRARNPLRARADKLRNRKDGDGRG
jgi:hypothetical protein